MHAELLNYMTLVSYFPMGFPDHEKPRSMSLSLCRNLYASISFPLKHNEAQNYIKQDKLEKEIFYSKNKNETMTNKPSFSEIKRLSGDNKISNMKHCNFISNCLGEKGKELSIQVAVNHF